jgi:hypothetical protein
MIVPVLLSVVVVSLSAFLAVVGRASVTDEIDALVATARRFIGKIAFMSSRLSATEATLEFRFTPPVALRERPANWLIVLDTRGPQVSPRTHIIRSEPVATQHATVRIQVMTPNVIPVDVAIYDLETFTPLGTLSGRVPRLIDAPLWRRVLASVTTFPDRLWRIISRGKQ